MRFAAGTFLTSASPRTASARPRGGRQILAQPRSCAWAVGHDAWEITVCAVPDTRAKLVTAGHCLATPAERLAALTAVCAGDLGPVSRMAGSHLSLVRTGSTLYVVGDRAGVVPVYWVRHEGVIWWSTAAAALGALTGAGPNLPLLLADLTLTGVDNQMDRAHYNGIRRVPPGEALLLGDAHPRTESVGRPLPLSFDEGALRLRDALTTAVGRRADTYERLSADLSGGMDSSTVACLAAGRRPVLAVTYTDRHLADDDDPAYARRTAAEVPGITHRVIDAREVKMAQFDGLADPGLLPFTDIPSLALGHLAIKEAQLAPAVAHESQAHLTGRGGDNVLTTDHSQYVDQFLARRRTAALRGAASYARAERVAPWRMWRQMGITAATSYPRALGNLAQTIGGRAPLVTERSARWENLAWCGATSAASWLSAAGRRAVADLVTERAAAADPAVTPAALHDRLALEFMAGSHAMYDALARQKWGLPIHAPFLDTAVVDACHAVPTYQRVREGHYKPLAQAAFHGLVPDFLLHRQTKTSFTTSLYTALAANAATLRRIIGTSKLAQAGLLDSHRAAADLEQAIAGAPAPLADLHTLIVTELWLTTLQTTYATWWQTDTDRSPTCG